MSDIRYLDQDITELYESLQKNILRQYFLILLQLQEKGINYKILNASKESLEEVLEPLKIFKNSFLADSLHDVLEPLYDEYRYFEWHVHNEDTSNLVKRLKYTIYWLEYEFDYKDYKGNLVFLHKDIQVINALHIALERSLKRLSVFSDDIDVILESTLWTAESIPDNILIQLNEVSKQLLKSIAVTPELMYKLSSRKFEELIAKLLDDEGFDVQLTSETRDGGRDIFASINLPVGKILTLVECKKWSPNNKVTIEPIRNLYGILALERATNAMLVTTSTFTEPAVNFVKSVQYQMSLRDYNDMKLWLTKYK